MKLADLIAELSRVFPSAGVDYIGEASRLHRALGKKHRVVGFRAHSRPHAGAPGCHGQRSLILRMNTGCALARHSSNIKSRAVCVAACRLPPEGECCSDRSSGRALPSLSGLACCVKSASTDQLLRVLAKLTDDSILQEAVSQLINRYRGVLYDRR